MATLRPVSRTQVNTGASRSRTAGWSEDGRDAIARISVATKPAAPIAFSLSRLRDRSSHRPVDRIDRKRFPEG